jgi:hypothetical protein
VNFVLSDLQHKQKAPPMAIHNATNISKSNKFSRSGLARDLLFIQHPVVEFAVGIYLAQANIPVDFQEIAFIEPQICHTRKYIGIYRQILGRRDQI